MKESVTKVIKEVIVRWVVEAVWPWFKEHIWPEIKEKFLNVIKDSLFTLAERIQEYFSNKFNRAQQENEAKQAATQQKVADAMEKARQAETSEEAEKYMMAAKIWEEVLVELKKENDALKAELSEIKEYLYTNVQGLRKEAEKKASEINPAIQIPEDVAEQLLVMASKGKE